MCENGRVSLVTALFRLVGSRQILNFNCPWLSLLSTRTKTIDPWCGFCYWDQYSGLQHLADFFLKCIFKVNWYMVCMGLIRCYTWVYVNMVGWPWKFPYSSNTSGYSCIIWSLPGDKLRHCSCGALGILLLIGCLHGYFLFLNLNFVFVFLGWSALLVIKLALCGK